MQYFTILMSWGTSLSTRAHMSIPQLKLSLTLSTDILIPSHFAIVKGQEQPKQPLDSERR